MKTHRRARYVAMHARAVPVQGLAGALRTGPPIRTARGILILALALGAIGAEAAASSAHSSADHASSHQPAANLHVTASAAKRPWIY